MFQGDHCCQAAAITSVQRRNIRSSVIGAYFVKKILRDSEIMKAKIIRNELRSLFDIKVSYDICLRGKNHALEIIYRKYAGSIQDLLAYLNMLKISNPSTITSLDIGTDRRY